MPSVCCLQKFSSGLHFAKRDAGTPVRFSKIKGGFGSQGNSDECHWRMVSGKISYQLLVPLVEVLKGHWRGTSKSWQFAAFPLFRFTRPFLAGTFLSRLHVSCSEHEGVDKFLPVYRWHRRVTLRCEPSTRISSVCSHITIPATLECGPNPWCFAPCIGRFSRVFHWHWPSPCGEMPSGRHNWNTLQSMSFHFLGKDANIIGVSTLW